MVNAKLKQIVFGSLMFGFISIGWLVLLYILVASPPMHWIYPSAPPAGPTSVYVPGSGFSGFWFHLGVLQKLSHKLHDYDFYCYSSGCLSKFFKQEG